MNRIFNLIWSKTKERWIVVSEKVKGNGKVPSSPLKSIALLAALFAAAGPAYGLDPGALPSGATITAGSATISTNGSQMTVNQSSQQMIANWQSFNIGQNAAVRFNQPGVTSSALNRITDQNPTQIMGSLSSNGQVFLLNPSGIIFGKTATVNVGGLVASSLAMLDSDYLAGKNKFANTGTAGAILNQGRINVSNGGVVALIAPKVTNEGSITANSGSALLAAGNQVTLDFRGDGLISYTVDQGAVDALVQNQGLIKADGGLVVMTAKAADALRNASVINSGVIEARTIEKKAGRILLLSDMQSGQTIVSGTLDASAPNSGDGGFIETSGAKVKIADGTKVTTLAPLGKSGTWLIDPTDITIIGGTNDNSLTGSNPATSSASTIYAGTIEAALGSTDVTITTSAAGTELGDINVDADLTWSANTLTLTAHHDININAVMKANNASLVLNYGWNGLGGGDETYGASGNLNMGFNPDRTFKGRVDFFQTGGVIPRSGSGFLAINGKPYTVITDLGLEGSLTGTDLQGINNGSGGYYALGSNINASATKTWNPGFTPIGSYANPFSGTFDGLGHTVSALSIIQYSSDIGLFGNIDSGSIIRNVSLSGVFVNGAFPGVSNVGGLVGANYGSIRNSSVIGGSVDGINNVGGLVGLNISLTSGTATISGCIVSGVSVNTQVDTENSSVGGLVGQNWANYGTANISGCSVIGGSVSGNSYVGGLVGQNNANYGTANISGCSVTNTNVSGIFYSNNDPWAIGGLVGWNRAYQGSANINDSVVSGSIVSCVDNGIYTGWVGGLVGVNNGGDTASANISGSSVTGGSVSGNSYVGGLVGWNTVGSITDSFVTGVSVTGGGIDTGSGNKVGGLVGGNYGIITRSSVTSGSVSGSSSVGGLVGHNTGTITDSFVNGSGSSVTGNSFDVGGFVGLNTGFITNSFYNIDNVTVKVANGIGGSVLAPVTPYGIYGIQFADWLNHGKTLLVGDYFTGNIHDGYYSVDNAGDILDGSDHIIFGNLKNILGFVNDSNGYKFKLTADITLPAGFWIPLFYASELNGNGKVITGLSINQPMNSNIGMIGVQGAASTIINLSVSAVSVTGSSSVGGLLGKNFGTVSGSSVSGGGVIGSGNYVGGLVGYNYGTIYGTISSNTVSDLNVTASGVSGSSSSGNYVGGLVGFNNVSGDAIIGATTDIVVVSGSGNHVGGLVGNNNSGTISGSSVNGGSVTAGGYNVGGLVGTNWGTIEKSHVTDEQVNGTTYVGGLVGRNGDLSTITESSVTRGSVTGTGAVPFSGTHAGGLVGYNDGAISGSTATSVNVSGLYTVGGLVGYNNTPGSISHSSVIDGSVSGGSQVGGLVGMNVGSISNSSVISTTGISVSGSGNFVGGLVGWNNFGGTITESFVSGALFSVSGISSVGGLLGYNGGSISGSSVTGVSVIASVDESGNSNVGGLAGLNESGTISGSSVTGVSVTGLDVTGESVTGSRNVGGLVGYNFLGSINDSSVSSGSVTGNTNIGGLVGYNYNGGIIAGIVSGVNVTGSGNNVGGLVGWNDASYGTANISGSSVNGGNVSGSADYVGGLVGKNSYGAITDAFVTNLSLTGVNNVGGLVGLNQNGTISGSSVTSVTGVSVSGSGYNVGGLVGNNFGSFGAITDSFVSGIGFSVSGSSSVGGLVGYNTGSISGSSVTGVSVTGSSNVGGLAGLNESGSISGSSVIGVSVTGLYVTGSSNVGGLVGYNTGSIGSSSVSGSHVTGTGLSVGGLVGYNDWGTISAGSVTGGSVNGSDKFVGGLVGENYKGSISGSSVTSVTGVSVSGSSYVGGLVGYNNQGSISDSFVTGTGGSVVGSGNYVGGLVGSNEFGTVSGSSVTGGSVTGISHVGGLVGYNISSGTSNIIGSTVTDSSVTGNYNVGGLVGWNNNGGISESSVSGVSVKGVNVTGDSNVGGLVGYNTGSIGSSSVSGVSVSGSSFNVGGLVGLNNNTDSISIFSSSVSGGSVSSSSNYVGGLVGSNSGTIKDSYASLSVTGYSYVGGLVGANSGTITNTYETGAVSGSYGVGALVGTNSGTINHSFYDKTVNSGLKGIGADGSAPGQGEADDPGHFEGKTSTELKNYSTFHDAGWDIVLDNTLSSSPPVLVGYTPGYIWRIKSTDVILTYTLSSLSGTYVYNGSEYLLSDLWSASTIFGSTYSSWIAGTDYNFTYSGSTVAGFTNAGIYSPITVDITKSGYTVAATGNTSGALTISRALATVTGNSLTTTYNGSTQSVSGYTVSALQNSENPSTVLSGLSATGASGKNYGSYTNTVSGTADNGNYHLSFVDGTLSIGKATVTLGTASKTYDGTTGTGNTTVTISGVGSEMLNFTSATYNSKDVADNSMNYLTALSLSDNGSYLASNYQLPTLNDNNAPATINPAAVNLTVSKTYNGSAVFTTGFTLSGQVVGETAPTVLSGNANVSSANANAYSSFISSTLALNNSNYTLTGGTVSATIGKATVTLGTASKTYDGTTGTGNTSLTINGVNSETLSFSSATYFSKDVADNSTNYLTALSLSDNGSYLASNYQLPILNHTNAPATISRALATVTGNSLTTTYTGSLQSVSGYTVSALQNGEVASTVLTGLSATGASGTNFGSYTNTVSGPADNGNYYLSFVNGTLTINALFDEPKQDDPRLALYQLEPTSMSPPEVISDGITVEILSLPSSGVPGIIEVSVPGTLTVPGSSFRFELPEQVKSAAAVSGVEEKITLMDGSSLPEWLHFDPATQMFTATNVQEGALPLQILISIGDESWNVEIKKL